MQTFSVRAPWWSVLFVCGGVLGVGYWQWTPLWTSHYVRQLAEADEESQQGLVNQLVALDVASVSPLLDGLRNPHPIACNNLEAALVALGQSWGAEDARAVDLAEQLRAEFEHFSVMGQGSALAVVTSLLRGNHSKTLSAPLSRTAGELVRKGDANAELRGHALYLAAALLQRVRQGQWLEPCRGLAERGLKDGSAKTRLAAVELVMRTQLRDEPELLAKVLPLLRDEAPGVRKAAIVALAPERELAGDDLLLPLLHDRELEVRQLCEMALRSRGLAEEHIELARLISDENPKARLKVLACLEGASDLDPGVWLRRLSHDSAPAVRAAAVRAVAQSNQVDLTDRLREISQNDPSETVRQNARFYLLSPR